MAPLIGQPYAYETYIRADQRTLVAAQRFTMVQHLLTEATVGLILLQVVFTYGAVIMA